MQKKAAQTFMLCLFMAAAWRSATTDKGSRPPLSIQQDVLHTYADYVQNYYEENSEFADKMKFGLLYID